MDHCCRRWLSMLFVLLVALPLFATGAQPTPTHARAHGQTPWPMFGFDPQHTHFNPAEHILSSTNVSRLTLDWAANVGVGGQYVCAAPAVADGLLYIDDGSGFLDAIDTTTGILRWQYNLNDSGDGCSSPAVVNGVVYIGAAVPSAAQLYALNAHTGVLLWSYTNRGLNFLSTPTVVNNVVYIEDAIGILHAFNARTGGLLWSAQGGAAGDIQIASAPAVANGMVYAPLTQPISSTIRLAAVNAQTGALLWETVPLMPLSQNGPTIFYAAPVVANGLVYISADPSNAPGAGTLDAVNTQTGSVVWSDALHLGPDQYPPVASVAVANDVIYVGSRYGTVSALNAQTGKPLWHVTFALYSSELFALAVANGVLYLGTSSYPDSRDLFALNAQTGTLLWKSTQGAGFGISSVVVVDGRLYAGCWFAHQLYAFHLPGKHAGS